MGHLHRRHRPNFKYGDLVRLTKGPFSGTLASVEKVYKRTVKIHLHHGYSPYDTPSHIVVKPSSLKHENRQSLEHSKKFYQPCPLNAYVYDRLGTEPTEIRVVHRGPYRTSRVLAGHSSRRIYRY